MNNYTQRVDKVGTDEVFPYPIKLEYDDEYIYLTPLWIPDYLQSYYEDGNLWLCLEVSRSRKNVNWRNNTYKHPTKTGNFYVPGTNYTAQSTGQREQYAINLFEIDHKYTFSIPPYSKTERVPTPVIDELNDIYKTAFIKVRGVYRISHTTAQWVSRVPGNTHSNTCKIYSDNYNY